MSLVRTIAELAHPGGRCNRSGFLAIAVGMLALQVAAVALCLFAKIDPDGPLVLALNLTFFWFVNTAVSKRLHDVGLSAWWILKAGAGIVVWTVVFVVGLMLVMPGTAFEPGAIGWYMAVGGTVLPVFAAILWLHCVHGEVGPNVYGAEPVGWGFHPQH